MIPGNVVNAVKAGFDAYYQARSEELDRQIRIAENQLTLDNLGRSPAGLERFREIYRDALRDCLSKLLTSLENALEAYDIPPEPELLQPMVDVIHACLQPLVSEFNRWLARAANNAGVPLHQNLDNEFVRLQNEARVEADLLLGRQRVKWQARQEGRSGVPMKKLSADETAVELFLRKLKNRPVVAIIVLISIVGAGVAGFTESIEKIWSFAEKRLFGSATVSKETSQSPVESRGKEYSLQQDSTTPPPVKAIPNGLVVAGSASKSVEGEDVRSELAIMFQESQKLSYGSDRDVVIKQLIRYGLKRDAPKLTLEYVENLRFSADRDTMYKEIFDHAVKTKRYALAQQLIDKLTYSADRDSARKALLDARSLAAQK